MLIRQIISDFFGQTNRVNAIAFILPVFFFFFNVEVRHARHFYGFLPTRLKFAFCRESTKGFPFFSARLANLSISPKASTSGIFSRHSPLYGVFYASQTSVTHTSNTRAATWLPPQNASSASRAPRGVFAICFTFPPTHFSTISRCFSLVFVFSRRYWHSTWGEVKGLKLWKHGEILDIGFGCVCRICRDKNFKSATFRKKQNDMTAVVSHDGNGYSHWQAVVHDYLSTQGGGGGEEKVDQSIEGMVRSQLHFRNDPPSYVSTA